MEASSLVAGSRPEFRLESRDVMEDKILALLGDT